MTDHEIFDLGPLTLQRGLTLPKAHLAYKTYGTLAADKSNVILYPTSYGAHHTDIEWLIGCERVLDPERYFIVIANQFGNGLLLARHSNGLRPAWTFLGRLERTSL